MAEDLKIFVDSSTKELIIRRGDAAPIVQPNALSVHTEISGPAKYFVSRRKISAEYFNLSKTLVTIDVRKGEVVLYQNPNDQFADVITGRIFLNPDLSIFSLADKNAGRWVNPGDLSEIFRRNIRFFESQAQAREMIANLRNIRINTQGKVEKNDDKRGTKTNAFEQSVESNVPVNFYLKMPIFEGAEPIRFLVEVFLEVNGSSVNCMLESVELSELIATEKERLVRESIEVFTENDVTVLQL
jgi:hypothetical protein